MTYEPTGIKKLFHQTRRYLARTHLASKKAVQIGITGSQGKTNTTYVITSVLQAVGPTVVTDTNLDTIYNVPITAFKVSSATEYVVWELGIDRPGEMTRHLEIAKPSIGIVTGISAVHTDKEHMGSLENLIAEKRKLIEALPENGYALLNWDDPNVAKMAPYTKATVLKFGTTPNCDVWVDLDSVHSTLKGISCVLHHGEKEIPVSSGLVGIHHIYNIMAAYLVFSLVTKADSTLFTETVQKLVPLQGRMSVEEGPKGTTLLNDALRANPTSTRFGLQTLAALKESTGKKIAILAEMGELDKTEEEHTKLGAYIATLELDYVICIGPLQQYVYEAALHNGFSTQKIFWVPDVFEAAKILQPLVQKEDIIYMKGSLLRHVERVLLLLNGTNVNCTVVSCPFYRHCTQCEYLEVGYQNVRTTK